jgi:hypothetical protein
MNSFYDDAVLQQAMANFGAAERNCNSEEMKLVCRGLAELAFAMNELQKRVHFIEEKIGVSPMRGFEDLLSPTDPRGN